MMEQNETDLKLLSYLLDELDDNERRMVEDWLKEDTAHYQYFRELQKCHLEMMWGMRMKEVKTDFSLFKNTLPMRHRLRWRLGTAAIIVLMLSIGGLMLWRQDVIGESDKQEIAITPGQTRAMLYLSSGEIVDMETFSQGVSEQDGTFIEKSNDGGIEYTIKENISHGASLMNRLEVPRGGEFSLTLSDGSRIWLNAGSKLYYPTRFEKRKREVYLEGEAYFEVTKDENAPFEVHVGNTVINVLGTEFNVTGYQEKPIETVLVNGVVRVSQGSTMVVLKPNQKATVLSDNAMIAVEEVDVWPYVAWRNGDFVFSNQPLEEIMEKLSLWYDLEVFYQNDEVRYVRLSGNLKRYKDVRELFRSFERISDVHFEVHGRTVTVSKVNG